MPNLFRRARKQIDRTPLRTLADGASPFAAPVRDVVEGPSHRFAVPDDVGWSGRDVEEMLSHYGVTLWGKEALGGRLAFTVRQAQADWTQYLLERHGLPIVEGALPRRVRLPTSLDGWCALLAKAASDILDDLGL